jgi:hypothetical protein
MKTSLLRNGVCLLYVISDILRLYIVGHTPDLQPCGQPSLRPFPLENGSQVWEYSGTRYFKA